MKNILSKLAFILLLLNMNCSPYNSIERVERKYRKMKPVNKEQYVKDSINLATLLDCYDKYLYIDLEKEILNTRILFVSYKHGIDLTLYPNFFICVTQNHDTIGLIDREFSGQVLIGELASIKPAQWNDGEKEFGRPPLFFKENLIDLYCKVKIVYRGKLQK